MDAFLLVMVIVLTIAVVGLTMITLGLAREIGRVQVRLGPLGARMMDNGPKVGQLGPTFGGLVDHVGREVAVGGHRSKPQLLLFTSPNCTTCKSMLPGVKALAKGDQDQLDVVIVSDGTADEHARVIADAGIGREVSYVDARDVGIAYQVGTTPYGIILDSDGTIRGKGLCNHMAHVESLINALETKVPTLQHLHRQVADSARRADVA